MATSSLSQSHGLQRVALYARVSTSDQSTDSQLLDLRRYVQDRGWQAYQEYRDDGISGSKDSRPDLNRLMNDSPKAPFRRGVGLAL